MGNYLVTGGAGFIGSHLTDTLIKDGHNVVIWDNMSTGKEENINKLATHFRVDVGTMIDPYNFWEPGRHPAGSVRCDFPSRRRGTHSAQLQRSNQVYQGQCAWHPSYVGVCKKGQVSSRICRIIIGVFRSVRQSICLH